MTIYAAQDHIGRTMSRQVAEFAYDLHSGLAALQVSEFDDLHLIGMAATLAIHIKGLGQIDYEREYQEFRAGLGIIGTKEPDDILFARLAGLDGVDSSAPGQTLRSHGFP